MRRNLGIKAITLIMVFITIAIGLSLAALGRIDNNVYIASGELDELNQNLPITQTREYQQDNKCTIDYRLCDIVPIKRVVADLSTDEVYLGGYPLGIDMKINGLIVSDITRVVSDKGVVIPLENANVRKGDVLTHINATQINALADVEAALRDSKDTVTISLEREGQINHVTVRPAVDALTHKKKLGIFLRENIQGIGTLTYINPETGRYGALGHVIKDAECSRIFTNPHGEIYNARIFGYVKGTKGKAGELSGAFDSRGGKLGTLEYNCDQGIFGCWTGDKGKFRKIKLGSKYGVRPGKATIITTIDGNTPKEYDIEIIKNCNQNSPKTRGLLIRVTDKELLEKTGGIVQGMSGSPIVQGGKLVGAVTHVFINDPKKGYGTYIDFMMPN